MTKVIGKCSKICSKLFLVLTLMLAIGVLYPQVSVEAKAKTPVITVKKIDNKTAKKVHQQLMKGKAFTVRFKCSEKNFYKKFQKLTKKVAKQTDVGFDVFPIFWHEWTAKVTTSREYTVGYVSRACCQEYIYGIKFAEREYKDFKADIKGAIKESEYLYSALNAGTVEPYERYKTKEVLISDTEKTITNLKALSGYLTKTKFRNLSGAMKARIVLPVGESAMSYEDKGHIYTFRALYKRKAYGKCANFARADCKISAVFSIGDFDFLSGFIDGEGHATMRVKVKTLGRKSRYVMLSNGEIVDYNDYAGFKISDIDVGYRRSYKKYKAIKKISLFKQLRRIDLVDEEFAAVEIATNKSLPAYSFALDKSEW